MKRLAAAWSLAAVLALPAGTASSQQAWLGDWAAQKQAEIETIARFGDRGASPFETPEIVAFQSEQAVPLSPSAASRRDATIALYGSIFGLNTPRSFLWTGIETGNPLTRDEGYRWNSLRDQGLFDPARREKLATELANLGVANLRIGLSNHEIDLDRPETWAEHDAFVEGLAGAGLNLSLDLHHFGVEDRFRTVDADGRTVPEASYYLHPDWPDYFARFAAEASRRYGDRVQALTIINEPETTVGFNSEMWHGAHPGWGDPRHLEFYVDRAFAIATGAVKARIAIEKDVAARGSRRLIYMHTEAAVAKPDRPAFERFTRFFPSDLILGQGWLMDANLGPLSETPAAALLKAQRFKLPADRGPLDWLVRKYVLEAAPERRDELRLRLVGLIEGLRGLHLRLAEETGRTMKTDTVFALDYYAHNEVLGASGEWLDPEPQHYAAQLQSGERAGLRRLLLDYYARYGMAMMIGETGTPFHAYGARWHAQLLLECAAAAADGVPLLGYVIYPAVDTWGWETALSVPKSQTTLNPGGALDGDLEPRPFMRALVQTLNNQTAHNTPSDAEPRVQ